MLGIAAMRYSPRNITVACNHTGSDALWRCLFLSRILKSAAVAQLSGPSIEVSEAESPIQCFTDDSCFGLPVSAGAGSAGNRGIPTLQRNIPVSDGPAELPRSTNAAAVLSPSAGLALEGDAYSQ